MGIEAQRACDEECEYDSDVGTRFHSQNASEPKAERKRRFKSLREAACAAGNRNRSNYGCG